MVPPYHSGSILSGSNNHSFSLTVNKSVDVVNKTTSNHILSLKRRKKKVYRNSSNMNSSSNNNPLLSTLIDVKDSVLVVIDVQDAFVDKLNVDQDGPGLVKRIVWLVQMAKELDVPLVVTAEDVPVLGSVCAPLAVALGNDKDTTMTTTPTTIPIYNKMVFGLVQEPEILAAIEKTRRKTIILVGLETDVCVAHSALGLLATGYQVAVVQDATGSPGAAHQYGLARMDRAGVVVTSVKGLYFEWARTVARDKELQAKMKACPLLEPPVPL